MVHNDCELGALLAARSSDLKKLDKLSSMWGLSRGEVLSKVVTEAYEHGLLQKWLNGWKPAQSLPQSLHHAPSARVPAARAHAIRGTVKSSDLVASEAIR